MSSKSGSGKILAIAGVFLAAVGGGAYWYFGVHAKNQKKGAAQAEITAWEQRLAKARECLFGATPASADSGEALAVRELTPDPWERKTCTKAVGGIARGPADDTGMMNVEHAWMTLDRAAAKVATAFAVSKDPYGKTAADTRRGVSDLPDALRELDKAHAELRASAGLPPIQNTAKVASLPVAQMVPFLLGGEEIIGVETSNARASSGALVAFGATKSTPVQITIVPGAAPRLERVTQQSMRSLTPSSAWGAAGLGESVVASEVDPATGAFKSPVTVTPKGASLLAAVGPLDDSLVVFSGADGLVFAHGKGAPPTFALDKPVRTGPVEVAFDGARGRALLVWNEYPEATRATQDPDALPPLMGTVVQGGGAVQPLSLGSGFAVASCIAGQHGFVRTSNEIIRVDQTGGTPMQVDPVVTMIGCGASGALLGDGETRFQVCTDACRAVELRGARPSRAVALADDHVVAVGVRERVLAVWSEKGPPAFYRLPEKVTPLKAVSDGKTIDVLGESETEGKPAHFVLVRVPAT